MAEFMKKDEAAKDKQHGEGAFPVREYVEQKVHLHLLYPQADAEPGFVVKGFDGFERSRIGGRTLVQRPADDVGNVHEADAAGQKRRIFPSKKAATPTSLAALSATGRAEPLPIVRQASSRHGKECKSGSSKVKVPERARSRGGTPASRQSGHARQ